MNLLKIKETSINNTNKLFNLEIDTKFYKMDQMAIKLTSNSNNIIEVFENTDCDYCTYQKIASDKNQTNLEIKKNNFVIFFEKGNISFFFLRINLL